MLMEGSGFTMHIAAAAAIGFRLEGPRPLRILWGMHSMVAVGGCQQHPVWQPCDVGRTEPCGKRVYHKSTRTCSGRS